MLGLFLGVSAGWHISKAMEVKQKYCSPSFPLLLTEVLGGRVSQVAVSSVPVLAAQL